MTPGNVILGILMVSSIVGLVTVGIAMGRELKKGRVFAVGVVTRLRKKNERPPTVDHT